MTKNLLTPTEPDILFEYEFPILITVKAKNAEEAKELANECLNRGMCSTYKMQRRISHLATQAVVEKDNKFKL